MKRPAGKPLSCVSRRALLSPVCPYQEITRDWSCSLSFGGMSCISFWKPTFLPPSWWCYPGFRFGSLSIQFLQEPASVSSDNRRFLRTGLSGPFSFFPSTTVFIDIPRAVPGVGFLRGSFIQRKRDRDYLREKHF